jgi:hypothetical protein
MKNPIFVHVLDSRDIQNFSGIRAAETNLEAIDVQNGEYDVYDAGGTKLNPQVWTDSIGVERVIILEADGPKNCEQELHEILLKYLGTLGQLELVTDGANLSQLVGMYERHRIGRPSWDVDGFSERKGCFRLLIFPGIALMCLGRIFLDFE